MGAALNHPSPVPEGLLPDDLPPQSTGYGQSKYIAEQLLATAAKRSGTPVTILRLGQIAGRTCQDPHSTTFWNPAEWFPSLVAGAAHLRMIPSHLGPLEDIAWLPVDVLAKVMVELMEPIDSQRSNTTTAIRQPLVYNLLNPRHTKFAELRELVKGRMEAKVGRVESVTLDQWVEAVGAEGETGVGSQQEIASLTNGVSDPSRMGSGDTQPKENGIGQQPRERNGQDIPSSDFGLRKSVHHGKQASVNGEKTEKQDGDPSSGQPDHDETVDTEAFNPQASNPEAYNITHDEQKNGHASEDNSDTTQQGSFASPSSRYAVVPPTDPRCRRDQSPAQRLHSRYGSSHPPSNSLLPSPFHLR